MDARSLFSGFEIGAPHAFVDHGLEIERRIPAHAHAHLDEHHHDAGVLADGPVSLGAHARIGEYLRDGVAGRRALLHVVGTPHGANEIRRVIVGNVLQGIGNAGDHIGFANHAHGITFDKDELGRKSTNSRAFGGWRIPYNRQKSEICMRRERRSRGLSALRSVLLNSGVLYSGVLIGALISVSTWVSTCLWTRPAVAAAAVARLPLHECRLEHPLRLASIPARCGVLKVPEDRTRPGGASIGLSVAVVPALNRQAAAAPLFLLAGGPGQGATAMYASYAAAFAQVNRNHDIVLVDQRGTGNSAPLSCDYPG